MSDNEFEYWVCRNTPAGLLPLTGDKCNGDGLTSDRAHAVRCMDKAILGGNKPIGYAMLTGIFPHTFPLAKPEGKLSEEQYRAVYDAEINLRSASCCQGNYHRTNPEELRDAFPEIRWPSAFEDEPEEPEGERWELVGNKKRCPKEGEHFICDSANIVVEAGSNFTAKRWVVRKVGNDGE